MSESPGLGPAWARGTQCCGKPAGCTNASSQCLMLNHPWKRWHARLTEHCASCTACMPGRACGRYQEILTAGPDTTPR